MGVFISSPTLANACSRNPDVLGTVSGVAAEQIMTHILQSGDPGEHFRRALAHFPFPTVAERIIRKYFVPGGITVGQKFRTVSAINLRPDRDLIELLVVASFAFVWLAREGYSRPVSINFLEKIQLPHLYNLTGAMLAGVDCVTMGAGITLQIPGVLDAIASGNISTYRVQVVGHPNGSVLVSFNPREFFGAKLPEMQRPDFLPIVSTNILASLMVNRLSPGSIQGFVIERPTAGGHNAPPREKGVFDKTGQPIYGQRDEVAFDKLRDLGLPFWVAGSLASPHGLAQALALGATGIQVGSIFALCEESGMRPSFRNEIRRLGFRGELVIRTDPRASPTGFPFKVVQLSGTQSDSAIFEARQRVCDVCALRVPCQHDDTVVYRCSGEPVKDYESKGGRSEDTAGVRCLCNGLLAAAGFGNPNEAPIFTLGDDVSFLHHLMTDERSTYRATDAIAYLLS
jgi:NAD(P)H-dependent flavin oxidoreductase YrpB (nitropropane dioxygenase family)